MNSYFLFCLLVLQSYMPRECQGLFSSSHGWILSGQEPGALKTDICGSCVDEDLKGKESYEPSRRALFS